MLVADFQAGRHGIILEIYTDDRSSPIDDNILSNNCPLTPTKGFPCRSSSAPGASPTNITLAFSFPSEKTRLVAVFFNEQPSYSDTANRSSSKLVILLTEFMNYRTNLYLGIQLLYSLGAWILQAFLRSLIYLLLTYLLGVSKRISFMPASTCHSSS